MIRAKITRLARACNCGNLKTRRGYFVKEKSMVNMVCVWVEIHKIVNE